MNKVLPRSTATDDDIYEQLHGLMHALRGRLREPARAGGPGLPPMEARALNFFARQPGATAADLVLHSGRDKAQIARLVKPLLDGGLLTREADATDGRSIRLHPTEAGHAAHRAMQQQRKRIAARLIKGLAADDLAQLKRLLTRLAENLETP